MVEHYFVAAWLPAGPAGAPREFYARKLDNGSLRGRRHHPVRADCARRDRRDQGAASTSARRSRTRCKSLAPGLDLVVDYGIFTVLAAPLFWLLKWLDGLVHNWGWAIVLLTIIIKSVFYPLNHASARSMAKMKVIAPEARRRCRRSTGATSSSCRSR